MSELRGRSPTCGIGFDLLSTCMSTCVCFCIAVQLSMLPVAIATYITGFTSALHDYKFLIMLGDAEIGSVA
jgi:hypothetical protein